MKLEFQSTKQSLPKNGEYIFAIINGRDRMYEDSGEPVFIRCEWQWNDEDGGSCPCDEGESCIENMPKDYKYLYIIDGEGRVIWTSETNKWNPESLIRFGKTVRVYPPSDNYYVYKSSSSQ